MTDLDLKLDMQLVTVKPTAAVAVPFAGAMGPDAIAKMMTDGMTELYFTVEQLEVAVVGAPRAYYQSMGPEGTSGYVALPVDSGEIEGVVMLPGGKWMRFTHRGPYRALSETYAAIGAYLKAAGKMTTDADWARFMPMWEEYPDDPATTEESRLLTYIYLPA